MQASENQRLKLIRKFLKLKQEDFGATLGLTQGGYSDIERGKNNVSGKIKIFLKNQHNINIHWLETGLGEMFATSIEEDDFDMDDFSEENDLNEKLKIEIEKLKNDISRLEAENKLYAELVKSKDKIIQSLDSQIKNK
tara:strand:- start:1619 stop:2032 length:414 start_codon:yes stop_codon:yes gene_type:complete